jgi:hypothetical protein
MTCTLAQSPKPFLKIQLEAFKKNKCMLLRFYHCPLLKFLDIFCSNTNFVFLVLEKYYGLVKYFHFEKLKGVHSKFYSFKKTIILLKPSFQAWCSW